MNRHAVLLLGVLVPCLGCLAVSTQVPLKMANQVCLLEGGPHQLDGTYSCAGARLPWYESAQDIPPYRQPLAEDTLAQPAPVACLDAKLFPDVAESEGVAARLLERSEELYVVIRATASDRLSLRLSLDDELLASADFGGALDERGYFSRSQRTLIPLFPFYYWEEHQVVGLGLTREGDLLIDYNEVTAGAVLNIGSNGGWRGTFVAPRITK